MTAGTLRLLHKLKTDPEAALAEMAAVLRSGQSDPLLMTALAQMIDPRAEQHPFGIRLKAEHVRAGAPKKPPNLELGRFISARIDAGEKVEVAIAEAIDQFGAARSTAYNALSEFRYFEMLRNAYHELVEWDRSPNK